MYILYEDLNSAGTMKTPYSIIIFKIPNLNWVLLEELFNGKNIDYDDLVIPTQTIPNNEIILNLGSYLFDYRFGFCPDSQACADDCCSADYNIEIINNLIDIKYSGYKDNYEVLYCPNQKYQIINVLKDYFENKKETNYIWLSSIDFDCGRYHQEAIAEKYCIKWNGKEYIYNNMELLHNDFSFNPGSNLIVDFIKDDKQSNSLFEISLNKVRQLFFSNLIDIKNMPCDILHEL
jgi:hypothetical protein